MRGVLALALLVGCQGPMDMVRVEDMASQDGPVVVTPDMAQPSGPVRYPAGVLHSPYGQNVIDRMTQILSVTPYRKDVFMKVGASNTVNTNFLHCFAGNDVMLEGSQALEPTRQYFKQTLADGNKTSFDRTSLSATVGWTAARPLEGNPSWLAQEIAAVRPAFALVMMGSNDTEPTGVHRFEGNLRKLLDAIIAAQVVPIMSTIPPRSDPFYNAVVPEMNAVIRALSQSRQVPYIDLWQTLTPLPSQGLISDGLHLNVFVMGGAHGCWFTPGALMFGHNQRNRLQLTALDRARHFLVDGAAAEPTPPALGKGTWDEPRMIDALPFVDDGDTVKSTTTTASMYSCGAQNESGPEIVYKIELAAATTLRARVFVDDDVDVDLHWLDAPDASRCSARDDKTLEVTAGPGTFWLAADSFVSGGQTKAGAYRLTLVKVP
jgi:hypothetical protein